MSEVCASALPPQTRPDKQAGQKEHELYEVNVLRSAKQIEAEPARIVADRDCFPVIWRAIECERRSRGIGSEVGQKGMERYYNDDDKTSQVIESRTGLGRGRQRPAR